MAILGKKISERSVRLLGANIVGMCLYLSFARGSWEYVLGREKRTTGEIEKLARQMTDFAVGGLKALDLPDEGD